MPSMMYEDAEQWWNKLSWHESKGYRDLMPLLCVFVGRLHVPDFKIHN